MKKLIIAAATLASSAIAVADYPDKPVTFVVPFAPGGLTDRVARDLAEAMREPLGATIVIHNMPGAGGTIGVARVAKSAPDGYTVLLHHIGIATAPALHPQLTYRTPDDFEFVGLINEVPMTLIGRSTLPANNYAELANWINVNKDKVTLANSGLGSASHLCGLLLQSALKVEMTNVPYKGAAIAMTDLVGGQVDLMCDQTTSTRGQIEGGKVKAFAVTTAKRLTTPSLAKLPTLDEVGLKGFNATIWHGLYAPKGTPGPVLDKLNAALKSGLKDAEFVKRQEALGAVVVSDNRINGAEHKRFVEQEIAKWTPVIKAEQSPAISAERTATPAPATQVPAPSLPVAAAAGGATCQQSLAFLASRISTFTAPELQTQRTNVLGQSVTGAIAGAKAQNYTSESAIKATLAQAREFDRVSREAAQCAADVDAFGATDDQFLTAMREGRAPNSCTGIRDNCICAGVINRVAAVGIRALAAEMQCFVRSGRW